MYVKYLSIIDAQKILDFIISWLLFDHFFQKYNILCRLSVSDEMFRLG